MVALKMHLNRILFVCLPVFIFFGGSVYAQISDHSMPVSFGFSARSTKIIPATVLDSVRVTERIEQDKQLGIPNRFGIVQTTEVDIREEGVKTEMNGTSVWQYEISCPDAVSLGLFFKTYDLPEGAAVYIYKPDKTQLRGGFTSANNNNGNQLAIGEFRGNSLIIEYDEPDAAAFKGQLVVGTVSTAYAGFQAEASSTSGRIQINCPAGDDWQTEKHAVCLMTFNDSQYSYYCSGALINNVREDGTPYFLTANHCISTNSVAATLVTYFNYENSTCESDDASLDQSLSGASLVATNSYSDFCLLKLSEDPPDDYSPFYAGWNASDDQPTSGTCIHHPAGTAKCIAIDNDPPVSYNYLVSWDDGNITKRNTHWSVSYETGADEGGSSGSPLFDSDKRIIGQLHGGDDTMSLFGKISLSWDYSSTTTKQLKTWLDPDNTGTLRLDGTGSNSLPVAGFSADVSISCLNTSVSLTDESKFSPTTWFWKINPETYKFVDGTAEDSQNPEVMFTAEGDYSVTLIAGNEVGYDTVSYENLIYATDNLPVGFVCTDHEITLCGYEMDNYQMIATGAKEYSFKISKEDYFNYTVDSDTITLSLKDEALQYGDFDTYVKVTGTHGNCTASDSVLFHVQMPANDDAKYAIALKLGRNAYFNNRCGTVEDDEPYPGTSGCLEKNNWCPSASGGSPLDNSVWYTFTGTSNHMLTIQTEGFDSQIAVYGADSYSELFSGDSASVSLLAANDNSSSGTAAVIQNMKVIPGKTYWLQVDGNGGDYGEYSIELLSNTIEVYPNPSTGVFHFTVSSYDDGLAQLAVFSFTGQQVLSTAETISSDSNTFDLDLSGLPSGFYLFRVNIDGLIMSKKLILAK